MCGANDAQRAHQLVDWQRGFAEHLRQLATHQAAVEFELPAALLRMHVADAEPGVVGRLRLDVGHIGAVALDRHRLLQPGRRQRAVQRREAARHIDRASGQQQAQQGQYAVAQALEGLHRIVS